LAVGAGLIYFILRIGKLVFGRHKLSLAPESKIVFTETRSRCRIEPFRMRTCFIAARTRSWFVPATVELVDRCYKDVVVRLSPAALRIDDEKLNPEEVLHWKQSALRSCCHVKPWALATSNFMGAILARSWAGRPLFFPAGL